MRILATALVAWVNTCLVSAAQGGNRKAKPKVARAATDPIAKQDAAPAVKSISDCPLHTSALGKAVIKITRFYDPEIEPLGTVVIKCHDEGSSRHDGFKFTVKLDAGCPKVGASPQLIRKVNRLCIPDAVYDFFASQNLVLRNRMPFFINHVPVRDGEGITIGETVVRENFALIDLRLSDEPANEEKFLNISPVTLGPSVLLNERLDSFFTRMTGEGPERALPRRPLLATAPIIREYIRLADDGTQEYVAVREYRSFRATFARPLTEADIQASSASVGASGRAEVSIDPREPHLDCCFCSDPKRVDGNPESPLSKLWCFHEYHTACLLRWFCEEEKSGCPECRKDI